MKHFNVAKRYGHRALAGAGLMAASAMALANTQGQDISAIGSQVATEIAKFAIMVSAIGAAVLSVIVLMQGFRIAFGMVRTAR